MSNVTPIDQARKPSVEVADRIEEQRVRIFRAMNLVGTAAQACNADYEEGMNLKGTLEAAGELLNDIALELNGISGR